MPNWIFYEHITVCGISVHEIKNLHSFTARLISPHAQAIEDNTPSAIGWL